MKHTQRIIIVTELFFPEESATAHIMTCIADHLASDNKVVVVTGPESYENEEKRISAQKELSNSFEIIRVRAPKLNKNRISHRVVRFFILSICLFWSAFANTKKGDILFSVTNPAPIVVLLAMLKKIKKTQLKLLVHDVFPENAVATGIIKNNKSISYRVMRRIFNWAYASADTIIAIGRDMADVIKIKIKSENSQEIQIIENWADTSLIHPIRRTESQIPTWGLEDKIVFQYAGNIGRAQGILELTKALQSVNNLCLHYIFTGSGALKVELEKHLARCNTNNFSTCGTYSRDQQEVVLGSCDAAIVVLGPGMYGLGVPSKTYNIMAAGKPILYIGPKNSEIYRLVTEKNIGWAFDWNELKKMIDFMNSIAITDLDTFENMGKKSRDLAEEFFTKSVAMAKFDKAIWGGLNRRAFALKPHS